MSPLLALIVESDAVAGRYLSARWALHSDKKQFVRTQLHWCSKRPTNQDGDLKRKELGNARSDWPGFWLRLAPLKTSVIGGERL